MVLAVASLLVADQILHTTFPRMSRHLVFAGCRRQSAWMDVSHIFEGEPYAVGCEVSEFCVWGLKR